MTAQGAAGMPPLQPMAAARIVLPVVWLFLSVVGLSSCAGTRPLPAPPDELYESAVIPGYPGVRLWGDADPPDLDQALQLFADQLRTEAAQTGEFPDGGRLNALVLSGGGSDGPFGAGFLTGWTETGRRPQFTIVTGISAGALIAPFAFLGPEYDGVLRDFVYQDSSGLVSLRVIGGLLDGLGVVDSTAIRRKIDDLITPDIVRRIAAEHDKGRRLLIGTTNLDAERPVYWRVDLIAKLGVSRPEQTADLIGDILFASAAIPGAFPPQFFEVTAGGQRFSEMHVDGGVTNQLFFFPSGGLMLGTLPPDILRIARRGTIYVIRNAKLSSSYDPVETSVVQIASRSLSAVLKFGGRGDIRLLEQATEANRFGVRIVAVPAAFDLDETEFFDPVYMQALFELGRDMAGDPDSWYLALDPAIADQTAEKRRK